MSSPVLVTGGAGYIGSHVVRQLVERKCKVVVLDDLSTGSSEQVQGAEIVIGSIADANLVTELLGDLSIATVVHMAAKTQASASVSDPLTFYNNNTVATLSLLTSCVDTGVENFVFASTAAVYTNSEAGCQVRETSPTVPDTPYGASKLMTERMLADIGRLNRIRHVSLRCFNAAGSNCDLACQAPPAEGALLLDAACQVASGRRDRLVIFGNDFPTPDGTGVRDFIHVDDIASAHLCAVDYLEAGGASIVLNCGYGKGYSVRDVIDAVERHLGRCIPVHVAERRPGDAASIVANPTLIKDIIGWRPKYDDLDAIVRSALRRESKQ